MSYTSPIIVGEAISVFLYFCNLKIENKNLVKTVGFITPAIFSVYIIHVHPLVFWRIINGAFIWLTQYNWLVSFLLIIAIALAIFMGCIALDYIRILLFKTLKINMLRNKLGENITKSIKKWCNYVNNKKKRNRA